MRWFVLLLALLLLPSAHAAWHYAGDTFTKDGVLYSVEGSDHEVVLLGVAGRNYLLRIGECVRNGLFEYCYVDTAYPSDDAHIKFEAGDVYYGYDISIEEVEPDVSVDRDLSEDKPLLNQDVTVTVTIENTGDYRVTNLEYEELLPAGLTGVGSASGGKVSYEKTALSPAASDRFTYHVKPTAYGTYKITPTLRYQSEGASFNATIKAVTITVASPVTVKHGITPTLGLEQTGTYTLNITNDDADDVAVAIVLTPPSGVTVGTPTTVKRSGMTYVGDKTLKEDETIRTALPFTANGPGKYVFSAAITTTKDGVTSTQQYNDTVTSTAKGIVPTIGISPTKKIYPANAEASFTGVLKNENGETGFRKVHAALSIPGIITTVTKDQGALGAGDTVTLFTERVVLPNVTNQTTYTARLSGSYEAVSGKRYEFSSEKTFTVAPLVEALTITHTFSNKTAPRGGNLTVTVSAKNIYGAYATIDAHERFPEGIVSVSGLTYAQISLERDATQQLYIYQITIPPSYASDTIELVTVARVQGEEEPQESSVTMPVSGTPPGAVQETPPVDVKNETVVVVDIDHDGIPDDIDDDIEKPGVFTRMWTWLKDFFA